MQLLKLLLAVMFFATVAVSAWAGSQNLTDHEHEERQRQESQQLEE
jgi:type II secretory pathway component PulJ